MKIVFNSSKLWLGVETTIFWFNLPLFTTSTTLFTSSIRALSFSINTLVLLIFSLITFDITEISSFPDSFSFSTLLLSLFKYLKKPSNPLLKLLSERLIVLPKTIRKNIVTKILNAVITINVINELEIVDAVSSLSISTTLYVASVK